MASMTSCGQNGLKNGVYQCKFTSVSQILPDTLSLFTITNEYSCRRTLIVKNDTVLYKIENIKKLFWGTAGTRDTYFLKLEKHADNLYKGKNEDIELNITVVNNKAIEAEVVKGNITGFHSSGAYMTYSDTLLPEKQILTFERELTKEDEENLSREREKIENKIIPENTLAVIKYEGFERGEIYLTEIHRVPVETKEYTKDSWYGKAKEYGRGEFLWFSFIDGNYPEYYFQQSGFLQLIPEDNKKFRLYLWRDFHLVFWKKELISRSKIDPKQWIVVEGVDDRWRKIVKYYMENLQ